VICTRKSGLICPGVADMDNWSLTSAFVTFPVKMAAQFSKLPHDFYILFALFYAQTLTIFFLVIFGKRI